MFDGIMCSDHDYLNQFINASRTSLPTILPLSFPLDDHNPCFHPSSFSLDNNILHQSPCSVKKSVVDGRKSGALGLQGERSVLPWSDEEVAELFKFRSSMESSSLPEFTWGHVSRKLAEIGFKRSAEECKEKFEQGYNCNNVISYNKSSRDCNELDEFYIHDHPEEIQVSAECCPIVGRKDNPVYLHQESAHKNVAKISENKEVKTCQDDTEELTRKGKSGRKRKSRELDELRGYFEAIVDKVMARQEELHNKLIESIVKRDEEKIAREEAWKIQEMNRSKTVIEMRAKDQANAEERQATIIQFLKKFQDQQQHYNVNKIETGEVGRSISSSSSLIPGSKTNPSSSISTVRWPRDEVLGLINLRCKVSYNNSKQGQMKGPLWERISQGMLELGYKRSAKRCKEKWENINKYFRKTKDGHKKRPVDSRTCPYFHELSCLYSGRSALGLGLVDTADPSGEEEQQVLVNN